MGAGAYGAREIDLLSTVSAEFLDHALSFSVGNSLIDSWSRDYLPGAFVDTGGGAMLWRCAFPGTHPAGREAS
jgi:hypothetical protein